MNGGPTASPADPLAKFAVHFTRGVSAEEARQARQRRSGGGLSQRELNEQLDSLDETGFRSSLSILWEGFIRPTTYAMGAAAYVPQVAAGHRAACLSETPLDNLHELTETRSRYGVGFTQDFLGSQGGQPVRYVPAISEEAADWRAGIDTRMRSGADPLDPFWVDTPFIEIIADGSDSSWEQEWRVPHGLRFSPVDVAFCFVPAELHLAARAFFEEQRDANTGPAYLGPYLDPRWDRATILNALTESP